jgi:hypothetical protein
LWQPWAAAERAAARIVRLAMFMSVVVFYTGPGEAAISARPESTNATP